MTTSLSSQLPVAEVFTSIHGEGYWAGTPMTFIRLAGCTVGRTPTKQMAPDDFPLLPSGEKLAYQCTGFDGRHFPCDTDYTMTTRLTVDKILSMIPEHIKHVCITGGEPLMHGVNLDIILYHLINLRKMIHFETSGTLLPEREWRGKETIWWAVSPKHNYLPLMLGHVADEVRVMVDGDLKDEAVEELYKNIGHGTPMFFCPLSRTDNVLEFEPTSLKRAMSFTHRYPGSRISIQQHKILGVR